MLRTTPHVTTDAIRAVGWSRRGMPPPCGATRATADMVRRIRMRTSSRAFAARQRVEVRALVGHGGVSASTSLFRVFLSLRESRSIRSVGSRSVVPAAPRRSPNWSRSWFPSGPRPFMAVSTSSTAAPFQRSDHEGA
jgi:hypothetical protein